MSDGAAFLWRSELAGHPRPSIEDRRLEPCEFAIERRFGSPQAIALPYRREHPEP
jgi:hypothetical protein